MPKVCSEGEEGKKCYEGSQPLCAGLNLTGQLGTTSRQAASTEALLLEEGEGDTVGCCRADRPVSEYGRALRNTGLKRAPYSKYKNRGRQLTEVHTRWVCQVVEQVVNGALACGCVLCEETQDGQPVHKQSGTVGQVANRHSAPEITGQQSRQQHAVQRQQVVARSRSEGSPEHTGSADYNMLSAAHMANRPFLTSLTLYVFRVFSLPLLKPARG